MKIDFRCSIFIGAMMIPAMSGLSYADDGCKDYLKKPLAAYDKQFYDTAIASADPSLWAKYSISIGCPEHRAEFQTLLYAIVAFPADAIFLHKADPNYPRVYAPDAIQVSGKFTGDQGGALVKAGNNELLSHAKSGGGLNLRYFSLSSAVSLKQIPTGLPKPVNGHPFLAFWIQYQCAKPGEDYGPVFGVNGVPGAGCDAGGGAFDRIHFTLEGPLAGFFSIESTTCDRDLHKGSKCDLSLNTDKIEDVRVVLTPKNSFRSLIFNNQL